VKGHKAFQEYISSRLAASRMSALVQTNEMTTRDQAATSQPLCFWPQVQDQKAAQEERECALGSMADERDRLDAALGSIHAQLAQAGLSRELRCGIKICVRTC